MAFYTPQKQLSFSRELRMVLQERNLLTAKSREKVCSMLNDSVIATSTPIDKSVEQRDCRRRAVLEIFTSEQSYLSQLELLLKFFVLPLKEKAIIDASDHKLLFGQIEMIFNLNREFLRALEADMESVAHAFLKLAPFFKFYSVYAFDYGKALLVLQDLTSRNLCFRKFLEQTESRPEVQRKLMSLLIVPIQRIPRYKLLLQQVLGYTSPSDPDYNPLRESIKQIEIVAAHINSSVQDQEVTQVLLNLQNSLCHHQPNIVQPSRSVLKEGVLQKVNRKGIGIKRYCVLMSDIFMYCKILKDRPAKTLVENSLECSCIFPLNKCKVYELLPGNFKITCQGDGLIFSTLDLQLQRDWVAALQDAIEEHLQCRKTLRKESSKRTPLRKKAAKNFGTDYVLSPKAKRGEFDSIFRSQDHSSGSEESDDSSSQNFNCFKSKRWDSNWTDVHWLKRQCRRKGCLKRCAPSANQNDENSLPGSQNKLPQKRCAAYPPLHKKYAGNLQRHNIAAAPSILKSKPQFQFQTQMDYDPSYGFAQRSYFRTQNVDDGTLRAASSTRVHLQSHDDINFTPPLKKRVKFDESANNTLNMDSVELMGSDLYGLRHTPFSSEDNCLPLHRKVWNFVTGFFQKSEKN